MFKKILIANRGEIACRVIKTARRLGIKTVAVFSDADRNALHVEMADEAIHIGAAPSQQSYLAIDKILAAVSATGADAVHPGYGFLSENSKFAEALQAANVSFIGPPVKAIEAMGDKITSKKIAASAGVATVPGHMGLVDDAEHAMIIAREIGYPVMIKASAGGGGKGMRIAHSDAEAREGFEMSRNEAKSSFNDDRIFVEKFITQPRHIEIQLLGDQHGTVLYLGERECSIQRRNQKVVEEAPSPFLDAKTRQAMGEQAVALAKAVGYFSAGTVEFIVDAKRNFYFLEMNTRLQVEHPVTELVTGIDIVEQMIHVAEGEKLAMSQQDIKLNGWAIESRLYAEDPFRGFLPSTGRLTRYRPPAERVLVDGSVLRNDTGVYEGDEISIHYDPMIAKLCTWAKDRTAAIDAMAQALDDFEVEGVGNNLPFLSAIMGHERFRLGNLTTAFIAEEFPDGFSGVKTQQEDLLDFATVAAFVHVMRVHRGSKIGEDWIVTIGDDQFSVKVMSTEHGFNIAVEGLAGQAVRSPWQPGQMLGQFQIGERHLSIKVQTNGSSVRLRRRGMEVTAVVRSPRVAALAKLMPLKRQKDTSKLLLCPMPGMLRQIYVGDGDKVEIGQALAVVEAMKMENILRSDKRGMVKRVVASVGDSLAVDQMILEFE